MLKKCTSYLVNSKILHPQKIIQCNLFKERKLELEPIKKYDDIIMPHEKILPPLESASVLNTKLSMMKMQKKLEHIRGPETVHNKFLYKQYGIVAVSGGQLHIGHINLIRNTINKHMDKKKMFAIWRIPQPWKPITRRGPGKKSGGGKASISFYVTPVKAGRVIVELGGKCEFEEVEYFLENIANKLPCHSIAISQEKLDEMRIEYERKVKENINPITKDRVATLGMSGCKNVMTQYDRMWNFEYEYS